MKRKIFFLAVYILIIITIIVISKNITIANEDDGTFSVFGYIVDKNNEPISNLKVYLESDPSKFNTTDETGFYYIDGLSNNDEITLKIDCENEYKVSKGELTKFDKVDNKNLQIEYIKRSFEDDKIIENYMKQIKYIIKNPDNRIRILNSNCGYLSFEQLNDLLDAWEQNEKIDSNLKLISSDRKETCRIGFVFTGENKNAICVENEDVIKSQMMNMNIVTKLFIYNSTLSDKYNDDLKSYDIDMIKAIYECLTKNKTESMEYNDLKFTLEKDSLLNIILKKDENKENEDANDNFIKGHILLKQLDNNVLSCLKLNDDNVKVVLQKKGENDFNDYNDSKRIDDSTFGFSKPTESGTYRIMFKIKDDTVNLQNYEILNDRKRPFGNSNIYNENGVPTNVAEKCNTFEKNYEFKYSTENEKKTLEVTTGEYYYNGIDSGQPLSGTIILEERERFCLTVKSHLKGYSVVLSNGSVYNTWEESASENAKDFTTVVISEEQSYGAKVKMNYIINVENKSKIKCNEYSLMIGSNLELKNSDKWERITKYYGSTDDISPGLSRECKYYYILKNKEGVEASKSFSVSFEGYYADVDSCIYSLPVEIVQYKNENGRRNFNYDLNNKKITNTYAKAGNYWKEGNNTECINESDFSLSEGVAILPPTGGNKK